MKPSRIMLMMALVILPLFVYASVAIGADDQATDRAPGADLSGFGAGFEGVLTPGDILWSCDITHADGDSDNQILGVEFDGYYYYLTGGGGTFYSPNDTNKVHIWERVGSSCNYVCTVNQPNPFVAGTWGWRDMAFDGTYLYASEEPGGAGTICTVQAWTANCDSVTLHPSADIELTLASFPGLDIARALAYDPANDWFWTASFSSDIYAFDRSGNLMQTIANGSGYDIYGLAWDNVSPGGPFLWVHCQTGDKSPDVTVRQVDPNETPGNEWTGVDYAGVGDASGGQAGGLCLNKEGCLSLVGVSQLVPDDSIYAMEISTSIVYDNLDTLWVPWAKVGRFANDRPVMGFRIDCVETPDHLEEVLVKSFITKAFSVDTVRLYAEYNGIQGFQVSGDQFLAERNSHQLEFDSNDTLRFFGFHHALNAGTNKFYIALCAHSDSIGAAPLDYHGEHLEVLIEPGGIVLSSGTNPDSVYNRPYGPIDFEATGFCPRHPVTGLPNCRYRLVFDTEPPDFVIHYAVGQTCAPDTIDQLDTIIVWADPYAADMDSIIVPLPFFGFPDFVLKGRDAPNDDFIDTLIIPDTNWTMPPAIDIDTGYTVEAMGVDTAGNIAYDSIYFLEPIDTYKPVIDSTLFFLAYNADGDSSVVALGDSLGIIVFCENNPKFEVSRGVFADLSNYFPTHPSYWQVELIDITDNNWIFRGTVYLDPDSAEAIDYAADSALNVVYITAYDNACNYQMDTAALGAPIDLEKPVLDVAYKYLWDANAPHWCIGIGDSVKMRADLTASTDVESVWVDMFDAGIDSGLFWAWYPLFDDGDIATHNDTTAADLIYNLKWEVGNPPLPQGKDADNTDPPPIDADYSVLIKAEDDAGNWDTLRSPQLNRTLDSRRPRPINPDSLEIQPLAGAKMQIKWGRNSDERDAWWFYIDSTTDLTNWGEIGNFWDGWSGPDNNIWQSEPLVDGQHYCFRITTKDNCDNLGPYTVTICAVADGTPPNACIVYPDSGGTYGASFAVKARSEDEDIDSVSLWYRFWPQEPPDSSGRGPWIECSADMYRSDEGLVFFDTIECIHDYVGWVELLPLSCDVIGNCQDIELAYAQACLDDDEGNLVAGHFFFYWDTTACEVRVDSVNGALWPQSACGFDVRRDTLNTVVINVVGATDADSFTVDVRALVDNTAHRILYRNDVTMPCIMDSVSVDNWPAGTQNLYAYVTNQATGNNCVPHPKIIELCVPQEGGPCMRIVVPNEWQRIPCSKTDLTCVPIWAENMEGCPVEMVTQVEFRWAPTPDGPWYFIDEVFDIHCGYWKTCWNNKEFFDADPPILHDGDEVYFIVIGYNQYHVPDTSHMVKVFLDCETPNVQLLMEPLYYTCGNDMPKISCGPLTLKAEVLDTLIDIYHVSFLYKKHSDPDMAAYWDLIGPGFPAHSENFWMYVWDEPCCVDEPKNRCLEPNTLYDIRVGAKDQVGNVMFDYDEDGKFDDSTFNSAVAFGAAMTVFVDNEAPQPAISMVADSAASIYNVNPSSLLGGNGKAYVKAGDDITVEISVLPSEDSCEVMKVEYYLCWPETCVSVGTSTDPYHYPLTFDPVADGIIPSYEFEDGWWYGGIEAELFDSLGNSSTDWVYLYILDVTPSQAVIINPLNDSYVYGDVNLQAKALNAYQIAQVCYEYRPDGDSVWYPVNDGYPNACVTRPCGPDESPSGAGAPVDDDFLVVWHTLNTVADGIYYLRAVATDCDNNVDDDPPTIRVTVANELPTAVIEDPRICERECPDDTVDILGYVADTVTLYATVSSTIPVDRVEFLYKGIFSPPESFAVIDTDYFPTADKYSVIWDTEGMCVVDGRYHLKARVYNAAGRYGDSEPVMVTVDNSPPFVDIISLNGNHYYPGEVVNISLYDTLAVEVVAIDSTSPEGWTRCYNSGVVSLGFAVDDDGGTNQYNWFTDFHDGDTVFYWNVSGLPADTYYVKVKAVDCLGNESTDSITIAVTDFTPPLVTIGGFYHNVCQKQDYIYGYTCDEDLLWAKFEYRKIENPDTSAWLGVGEADYYDSISGQSSKHCYPGPCCCDRRFIQWVWDPSASLVEGEGIIYQGRILATDYLGNNSEDSAEIYAPIVNFTYENGVIVPEPGPLGALSFKKNFMVGRMHGTVEQNVDDGLEPQVFGLYLPERECGNSEIECVWMQQNLNVEEYFAGSFEAGKIHDGGIGVFFSSVTKTEEDGGLPTGEEQLYTYLRGGDIMVVKVDRDLGTFTKYCTDEDVCVYVPGGALGVPCDKHLVVWPEEMPPVSLFQPTWIPVGDDNGLASYIGFTESRYYACGGGDGGSGGSTPEGDYWCFDNGRYATIKINYDTLLNVPAESLIVAWWDNDDGKWKTNYLHWGSPYSEGFNTDEHYVEFVAECLHGPFAVIYLQERECEGTIAVQFMGIDPYCDEYTSPMPKFRSLITDNIYGTDGIDKSSITFKLKKPGEPYIPIYDGDDTTWCGKWAKGFGQYNCGGYDPVSGIFGVGWNDTSFFQTFYFYHEQQDPCPGCYLHHYTANYNYYQCFPAPGLAEGDSFFAQVSAENYNNHSCTQTLQFKVDATKPWMQFADSGGAYVGENPHFCIYFNDAKSGVDKSSIWIDIYGDETSSPDPNYHNPIATFAPDQLHWDDDTTVCLDFTFEYRYGYMHIFVYGGPDYYCWDCGYQQFYGYLGGIADCVGNRLDPFWQYYTVDADGPTIVFRGDDYCDEKLQFEITDDMSGLLSVYLYEDSSLATIEQDVHNPDFWWYTPSEGVKRVDIKAVDNLDNKTVFSFDLPSDCGAPTVTFADGYVAKNPIIKFWVTDPAGVDWTTVNARVYGCGEECLYRAEDLPQYTDTLTGEVTLSGCHLDCYDGNEVEIYVFSGSYWTSAGPCDLEGNCGVYRRCSFVVDGYGPSISWMNSSDPCDRPVKLKITDAKSGLAEVKAYEDGIELSVEAFVYDTSSGLYHLTPSAGIHDIDVVATDVLGNQTIYSFEVRDDCLGPAVSFPGGYVTKNPTLQFVVKDDGSGVDWTTVSAWVIGCNQECVYLAPELIYHVQNDTLVTLEDCQLDCPDGYEVEVYVYSGTYRTGKGPADLAGNYAPAYSKCSYTVDAAKPYLVSSIKASNRPIEIKVADNRSGIDWSTLKFYEDSLLICEGLECTDSTVVIDTAQGIMEYMPPAGRLYVQIHLRDYAGNLMVITFYTEEEHLSLTKPHNYPNPFDPREKVTHIVLGINKTANVTVKIYDFAGEYVRTVGQPNHEASLRNDELIWDGTSDDGTEVANGTYLCHIKARDNNGAIKTAVIKITVLKKDK